MGNRASGVLLHPTSLPGPFGIGDLGPEAYRFADWLAGAGQRIWQVLPLNPTGYGESPYAAFSAFAGNPMLVSLEYLVDSGLLKESEIAERPPFPKGRVDFEQVVPWKTALLRRAFERFWGGAEFERFAQDSTGWLEDFVRFMALKRAAGGVEWRLWPQGLPVDAREMGFHRFLQFEFFRQWHALKAYCAKRGIRILGDVPIYVATDSADVWAHPELFRFDVMAGVPPDYFSATGQLWGNPIYRWDRMAAEGYSWWVERMRAAFALFDLVRMDHFRGFEAYWEVPAGEKTAVQGRWVKGPGSQLFHAVQRELGALPLIAENLGVITEEVEAIRREYGFPGMAVLQFAFGNDEQAADFRPHNYTRNLAAYTGTHDNDTAMGWWRSKGGDSIRTPEEVEREKELARVYLNSDGAEMHWVLIRALMASVADTVVFPAQDLLGLGSEARMNQPATISGNWAWRLSEAMPAETGKRLGKMTRVFER
jgi:4-alpha-glucanotransferase